MNETSFVPPRMQMDFAGSKWIERGLFKHKAMSPLGVAVADALGYVYRGIYHLPPGCLRKTDWNSPHCVRISVPKDLCTWDGDELTRIVVVCHDLLLRMEVDPAGAYHLRLSFSQRRTRQGQICTRMPTLEEHVAMIRKGYDLEEAPLAIVAIDTLEPAAP